MTRRDEALRDRPIQERLEGLEVPADVEQPDRFRVQVELGP